MVRIADDYAEINIRLREIRPEVYGARNCRDCMNSGYKRVVAPTYPHNWIRIVCPSCGNPQGLP